jgi:hypothetical protein
MKYLFISLIMTFMVSCSSTMPIQQKEASYSVQFNKTNTFEITDKKYFITGYSSDLTCSIVQNLIININPSDSALFYKINGSDNYFVTSNQLWIFDISKKSSNENPNPLLGNGNISKIPDALDDFIKSKINVRLKGAADWSTSSPIIVSRHDIDYDNTRYEKSGQTDLSYFIDITRRPQNFSLSADHPLLLLVSGTLNIIRMMDEPSINEIIYVETFRSNYIVNDVSVIQKYYLKSNFDLIDWQFTKNALANYLIIHFKMNLNPLRHETISLKVNGNFYKE